jgi:hypothetical protein
LAFVTRRPEILKLFETHVYGGSPAPLQEVSFQVTSSDGRALGGKATRKEVSVDFTGKEDGPSMSIVIFEIESPVEPAIASESPRD